MGGSTGFGEGGGSSRYRPTGRETPASTADMPSSTLAMNHPIGRRSSTTERPTADRSRGEAS